MSTLTGKTIFITGGNKGIGKAAAAMLLAEGANIFAIGRTQSKLDELAADHPTDRLVAYACDVTSEAAVEAAFEACRERFGGIDVLINNAGIGLPTPDLAETDLATYESMVNVNMTGLFLCTREALKIMKPSGKGHIINVVSVAGQSTNPTAPLYCASKFGARGISSGTADQVLKLGIKVTDVNPGPVNTDYWGERAVPREKFLSPEDVAGVIRFVVTLPEHVLIQEINFNSLNWMMK